MEKKFIAQPPIMPNFISFTRGNYKNDYSISLIVSVMPVKDLTKQEAEEYGDLMKQTFIKHWENKQKNK